MESYIVRIYRRDRDDRDRITGLVEDVDGQKRHRFTSFEGLRRLLAKRSRRSSTDRPPRAPATKPPKSVS